MTQQPDIRKNTASEESLPFLQATVQLTPTAPEHHAGSFSYLSGVPRRYLETPVDASTGVPLPIYPSIDLPPVPEKGQKNLERLGDWHHPFHPRSALIHGDLGLQALRGCRVQWVKYEDHHDGVGYHQTLAGPALPSSEFQLLKTVVFACAGFIGPRAIAFAENGQHSIKELSMAERKRLLTPGILRIDDYFKVSKYLLDYGARKSIAAMDSAMVDELLHSTDTHAKERIASEFISYASEEITGNFKEEFRQAKREKWLPNERTASAANYVRNLLTIRRDGTRSVDRRTLRCLTQAIQAA